MDSRSKYSIILNEPIESVDSYVKDYLIREGFRQIIINSETIWQNGSEPSLISEPKCFKYSYLDGTLTVEAWFRTIPFTNKDLGERDLKHGSTKGILINATYENEIKELFYMLSDDSISKSTMKGFGKDSFLTIASIAILIVVIIMIIFIIII